MKRIVGIVFQYDDGTTEVMEDKRACAMFQSRCNSSGMFSGMEDYIKPLNQGDENVEQVG